MKGVSETDFVCSAKSTRLRKVKFSYFLPVSFCETVFTPSSVCTHAKTVHGITDMKDYGPFNYLRQTYHKWVGPSAQKYLLQQNEIYRFCKFVAILVELDFSFWKISVKIAHFKKYLAYGMFTIFIVYIYFGESCVFWEKTFILKISEIIHRTFLYSTFRRLQIYIFRTLAIPITWIISYEYQSTRKQVLILIFFFFDFSPQIIYTIVDIRICRTAVTYNVK